MASFLNLKAMLSLNASGFQLGMKRAESQAKAFAKEIKREFVGAFGTAAMLEFSAKIIETADRLVDLSTELGVSTKTLQEWGYAAKKNGRNLDDVAKFFENIANARERALRGSDDDLRAFERLGVGAERLKRSNLQGIGSDIWKKVFNTADVQSLIAPLKQLGGKSDAQRLIPMFKEDMKEIAEEAAQLGQVMDDTMLLQLKQAKNEAEKLADSFKGPVANAIIYASKALQFLLDKFTIGTAAISAFLGAMSASDGTQSTGAKQLGKRFAKDYQGGGIGGLMRGMWSAIREGGSETKNQFSGAIKAAEDAMTSAQDKINARQKSFDAQLATNKALGNIRGSDVTPDKFAALKITTPDNLSSWQKAGGGVRQGPMIETTLKTIAENTERAAQRLEELKNIAQRSDGPDPVSVGGFQ
jgi:hypothetical protein